MVTVYNKVNALGIMNCLTMNNINPGSFNFHSNTFLTFQVCNLILVNVSLTNIKITINNIIYSN